MPNFVGQPLASATRVVQAAGIKVGIITVDNTDEAGPANGPAGSTTQPTVTPSISPSPESLVLSQNPPAGQKISAGTAITFEVSK
jgi:beta-lactam-binding protein with PASTA domain